MRGLVALLAGLVFGAGLTVSQMVDPAKVLGFLDLGGIPAPQWDPSLAFVMAGALIVTAAGYALARARGRPILGDAYHMPAWTSIDPRLIAGTLTFGVGWGLVGYCPGPAIAGLAYGATETFVFVGAMLAGMLAYQLAARRIG